MRLHRRSVDVGFDHRPRQCGGHKRCLLPVSELIATVALAISTAVAITVVSMEIAQADTFGGDVTEGGGVAVATFLGLLIAAMGVITAVVSRHRTLGQ